MKYAISVRWMTNSNFSISYGYLFKGQSEESTRYYVVDIDINISFWSPFMLAIGLE